jgi:signal transduction histidine kinase
MVSSSSAKNVNRLWMVSTGLIGAISAVVLVLYLALALNWRQIPFIGAMFTPLLVVDGSQSLSAAPWPGLEAGLRRLDRIVAINDDVLYDPQTDSASDYVIIHERYFAALAKLAPGAVITVEFERPAVAGQVDCPANSQPAALGDCRISYTVGELPLIDFIGFFVVPFITAVMTWGIGAAILVLRPNQPAARLISVLTFALAVLLAGLFDIDVTHAYLPFWLIATVILGGSLATLALIFPARMSLVMRYPQLVYAPSAVCLALAPLFLWLNANPPSPDFQINIPPFMLVVAGMLLLVVSMFYHRRYATSATVRDQSNTILIGIFLTSVPIVIWLINLIAQTLSSTNALPFNTSAATPFILTAPLSMAYAVLQYRFFDTDRVLSRGITYFIMLAALVAGYALLVFSASLILTQQEGISANNPLLIGVTIFIIALLFLPVRNYLQTRIDSVYFRRRYDFQEYVEIFTHEISRMREMNQVVQEFRDTLAQTLAPSNLFVFVPDRQTGGFTALGKTTDVQFAADSGIVRALRDHDELVYLEAGREWPLDVRAERSRLQILNTLVILGLRGSEHLNGFVCVGPPQSGKGRYEHEELFFIQSLVSQMSIAAERAQVIDSLQRRVRELDVLSHVGQAVNFAINLDDLMELLYTQTNRLIDATYFYVVLRDEITDELYFAFFLEDDERYPEHENKPWPIGSDLFSEIVLTSNALRVANYAQAMAQRNAPVVMVNPDLKAWMGLPLMAGTRNLGAMAVGTTQVGKRYGDDQFRIFSDISSLAAASIDKARLFAETNKRARQLAVLNDVSNQLASEQQDLDKLLDIITRSAVEILNAEAGSLLMMVEGSSSELEFKIAIGSGQELLGKRFPARQGLTGEVIRTGRYVIVNDAPKDPRWAGEQTNNGFRTQAILAVPLIANNQTLGVLEVLNQRDRGIFVEEDANLLTTFAGQAAIVIDNARLFQMTDKQLSDRVAELEALERIDVELNRTLDIKTVAERTLRWAVAQTGATAGVLGIVRGDPPTELEIAARYGYREGEIPAGAEGSRWPLDKGIVKRVMRTRRPDLAGDVRIDPDWVPGQRHCLSQITVPLMSAGEINAILVLEKNTEPRLSLVDMAFVQRLTEHATIALVNAQLYVDLARANDSKSEFVSFVAHELKNPMTSIKGYTDLLLGGMPGAINEQQETFLNTIKGNIERMNTLVSDLNDVTKLQTGNFRMEFAPVDFRNVVHETLRPLQQQIEEKQQTVHLTSLDHLPQIRADQNRLIQVLTNLVSNAHKYTPHGGRIEIRAEVSDNHRSERGGSSDPVLHICVQDSGIGMSEDDQARLFTPYFRSDNPLAREQPGTGLGLTITRGIVEGHGGSIWVESDLGVGTCFHFTVPLAVEKQHEAGD